MWPPASGQNIIRVIKVEGKRWIGHVAYVVKMGNIHNIHIIRRFQTKKLFMIISHKFVDYI
jgi:hypothetical protein